MEEETKISLIFFGAIVLVLGTVMGFFFGMATWELSKVNHACIDNGYKSGSINNGDDFCITEEGKAVRVLLHNIDLGIRYKFIGVIPSE